MTKVQNDTPTITQSSTPVKLTTEDDETQAAKAEFIKILKYNYDIDLETIKNENYLSFAFRLLSNTTKNNETANSKQLRLTISESTDESTLYLSDAYSTAYTLSLQIAQPPDLEDPEIQTKSVSIVGCEIDDKRDDVMHLTFNITDLRPDLKNDESAANPETRHNDNPQPNVFTTPKHTQNESGESFSSFIRTLDPIGSVLPGLGVLLILVLFFCHKISEASQRMKSVPDNQNTLFNSKGNNKPHRVNRADNTEQQTQKFQAPVIHSI